MIAWLLRAPPTTIGRAEPDDWADLAAMHAEAFAIGWGEDELARLAADPAVTALVARRANAFSSRHPTGFIMVRQAADEAELLTVVVHPRRRGGGIGRQLVEAMLRMLYADRVRTVFLEVADGNAAALALYRRLGFRQVGERRAYYRGADGTTQNALILSLDLVR